MKYLMILLIIASANALAGEHGEASIKELAWPAFNFCVLFSILFWKARKPLAHLFTEKSKKVQAIFRVAENKYKEAQEKYSANEAKLKNADTESDHIMRDAKLEAEQMEVRFHEELKARTERMWSDSHNLIDAEKKQLETELNAEIIETVVAQAKDKIKNDKNIQKKASTKILASLGR